MHDRNDSADAPRPRVKATGDALNRIAVRLKRIAEETRRMLDGGSGSAYTVQQTVRSIQADVERLQRRQKPRARVGGAPRRG